MIALLLPYRLPATLCLGFIGVVYFCFKIQENVYGNEGKIFSRSLTDKVTFYEIKGIFCLSINKMFILFSAISEKREAKGTMKKV